MSSEEMNRYIQFLFEQILQKMPCTTNYMNKWLESKMD